MPDIEQVLKWAFTEELPKAVSKEIDLTGPIARAWRSVESFGELMAVVDAPKYKVNEFGLISAQCDDAPHPLAVAMYEWLARASRDYALAPDVMRGLLSDIEPCDEVSDAERKAYDRATRALSHNNARRAFHMTLPTLMQRCAVLGPFDCERGFECERKIVTGPQGRPLWFRMTRQMIGEGATARFYDFETDGYDHKKKRPYPGAYHHYWLDPDPVMVAENRLSYRVWFDVMQRMRSAWDEIVAAARAGDPSWRDDARSQLPDASRRVVSPW